MPARPSPSVRMNRAAARRVSQFVPEGKGGQVGGEDDAPAAGDGRKGPETCGQGDGSAAMRVREAQARVAAARESHGRDKTSAAGASKRAAHGAAPAPAPAAAQPHKVDDDKKTADATMSVVDLDDEFE